MEVLEHITWVSFHLICGQMKCKQPMQSIICTQIQEEILKMYFKMINHIYISFKHFQGNSSLNMSNTKQILIYSIEQTHIHCFLIKMHCLYEFRANRLHLLPTTIKILLNNYLIIEEIWCE